MSNKYSCWQRVDLHIHTDLSKNTKDDDYTGTFSVKTLHEKLREQNVKIFSLTDHNIINLLAYKEYYKTYQSKEDPLLLLGIELDIERKDKTYHSLLIFNYSDYEKTEDINTRLEKIYKEKGCEIKTRKLSIDDIINIFPKDDFFFIPHAGNTTSIVDGYKGEIEEAQKMLILLQSPLEKVPEKKRQIFNENFDKVLYEAFKNKNDYAYIEFSDNHNISKYPCKHKGDTGNHEFYYIKGSKNYETLRLAFIDPKSRIISSPEFQSINQGINYIEKLSIKSNNNIADTSIEFSPHMNVIIGGRSSGKSLLLDILDRSIDTLTKDCKYDSILSGTEFEIKSKFDGNFKKKTTINTAIVQINQGDIVNYFENNNLEELAKKSGKIDNYNAAKEKFLLNKADLQLQIDDLLKAYKKSFDCNITQGTIIHKHTLDKVLSDQFLILFNPEEIEKCQEPIESFVKHNEILNNLNTSIKELNKSKLFSFTVEETEIINAFESLINIKSMELKNEFSIRNRIANFLTKVDENIKLSNSELSIESKEKAEAQKLIKKTIDCVGDKFKTLRKLCKISNLIERYNLDHKESFELDSECSLCLEIQTEDNVSSLILDGMKTTEKLTLYLCLLKLLYGDISIKNYANNDPENLKKKTTSQLSNIFTAFDKPKDYLGYKDGSNSKSNSPGYNSEKYLQVILNNPSSSLIMIDQPEDNLGNKFISEKLVDIIRGLKFKKQIILVTHNPAIVVYGDAESIILAKNDDNEISYTQIKLESEIAQKDICAVLDGGEYVFNNRAMKYNIQKLLSKGD